MPKSSNKYVCPRCGDTFTQKPAISRLDNKTEICPLCGCREALEASNLPEADKEFIMEQIIITKESLEDEYRETKQ